MSVPERKRRGAGGRTWVEGLSRSLLLGAIPPSWENRRRRTGVKLPGHRDGTPGQSVKLPGHRDGTTGQRVKLPGHRDRV